MDNLTKVSKNLSKTFFELDGLFSSMSDTRGVLNHVNNFEPVYVQPPPSVPSNMGERDGKGNVDESFGSPPARWPYYANESRQGMTDH